MMNNFARRWRGAGFTALLVAGMVSCGAVLAVVLWRYAPHRFEEHDVVEWAQAALLFAAVVIHGRRSAHASARVDRTLRIGLALLCASLCLREVDIDALGPGQAMRTIELTLRWAIVAAWVVFAWWGIGIGRELWAQRRAILQSRVVIFTVLGGACYIASRIGEAVMRGADRELLLLVEETLELAATSFILLGAAASTGVRSEQRGSRAFSDGGGCRERQPGRPRRRVRG